MAHIKSSLFFFLHDRWGCGGGKEKKDGRWVMKKEKRAGMGAGLKVR